MAKKRPQKFLNKSNDPLNVNFPFLNLCLMYDEYCNNVICSNISDIVVWINYICCNVNIYCLDVYICQLLYEIKDYICIFV